MIIESTFNSVALPLFSDSFFWSAAYFCTSSSSYQVCDRCGAPDHSYLLRVQNQTSQLLSQIESDTNNVVALTRMFDEEMEDHRRRLKVDVWKREHREVLEDFGALEFKFSLVKRRPLVDPASGDSAGFEEEVTKDFFYQHFMDSALFPGKEGLLGVSNRLLKHILGRAGIRKRPRVPLIAQDPEKYCGKDVIVYLNGIIFKLRELTFFMLNHNRDDLERESKLESFRIKSEDDQERFNNLVTEYCPEYQQS